MRTAFHTRHFGRDRRGFTALEMMMTLVVASLVISVMAPSFHGARTRASVHSAQSQVASLLYTAKAAAIRRGDNTRFNVASNRAWVEVSQGGAWVALTGRVDVYAEHKVQLSSSQANITFDSRGLASGLGANEQILFRRDAAVDTVCVTRTGAVLRGGCNL